MKHWIFLIPLLRLPSIFGSLEEKNGKKTTNNYLASIKIEVSELGVLLDALRTAPPPENYELKGRIMGIQERILKERYSFLNNIAELENVKIKLNNAEEKLQLIEKPAQIRVIIDDTEARFDKPSFCENCLQYGHKTKDCSFPKARKSSDPKRNRILNRKRFWTWILENHSDDDRISSLLKELKMNYDNDKPENTTFEVYKEKFCESVGEMYESVSSKIHAFEFAKRVKNLNIFGSSIDRFVDPIIRSLGNLPDLKKPAVEYEE